MGTELGKIAGMIQGVEQEPTPLQMRLPSTEVAGDSPLILWSSFSPRGSYAAWAFRVLWTP
jgi:hypothetical protein